MFDLFKNKKFEVKNLEFIDESNLIEIPETNLSYNSVEVVIGSNKDESLKHVDEDFEVVKKAGIESLIKSEFIPWLKNEDFKDLDDNEIYNGLKLTNIYYNYHRIVEKYSPTKQDDFFGEFEFHFESGNSYTEDLIQASAFVILVNKGKIYFGYHFDI